MNHQPRRARSVDGVEMGGEPFKWEESIPAAASALPRDGNQAGSDWPGVSQVNLITVTSGRKAGESPKAIWPLP